jgi:hypothetical protein
LRREHEKRDHSRTNATRKESEQLFFGNKERNICVICDKPAGDTKPRTGVSIVRRRLAQWQAILAGIHDCWRRTAISVGRVPPILRGSLKRAVANVQTLVLGAITLGMTACSQVAWTLPDGVLASEADLGRPMVGGIYASNVAEDPTCCWIGKTAHFSVEKEGPATDLALQFYVPNARTFRVHPQGLLVTINSGTPYKRCCFSPGLHTLLVPLPHALRMQTGRVVVDLTVKVTFVPARDGFAADRRTLGTVLHAVDFRTL